MDSSQLEIRSEPLKLDSRALHLAMQCWPEAEREEQLKSLHLLTLEGGGGFLLLAARREWNLVGAILAQLLPGKAATLWPAQLAEGVADAAVVPVLVSAAEEQLAAEGAELCQALLGKDQTAASTQLAAAGYQHPADLLYMTCEGERFPAEPPDFPGFHLRPFQLGKEAELARLLDETYVGTQDCPAVNGLRSSLDVVTGYQHVGQFSPSRWQILESTAKETFRQAAGCLLLARHATHDTMEIVYVGVTSPFRRQGLGQKLTRQAQWLAGEEHCQRLVLAVDAANEPAIAMYAAAGFWAWEERAIWVKKLV